jgi:hypothetical protein
MNPYEAPREKPSAAPAMAACAEVLVTLGATPREAKPWSYRMLWRIGLEARPPLYGGLLHRMIHALSLAGFIATVASLTDRHETPVIASAAGLLIMTFAFIPIFGRAAKQTRKKRNLPDWEQVQALATERMNIK